MSPFLKMIRKKKTTFVLIGSNSAISIEFSAMLSRLHHRVIGISLKDNINPFLDTYLCINDNRVAELLLNLEENSVIVYFAWRSPTRDPNGNYEYTCGSSLEDLKFFLEIFKSKIRQKFLFISSAGAIYGNNDSILTENTIPKPLTPYGVEKLKAEELLQSSNRFLNMTICRITNPYGFIRQPKNGIGFVDHALRSAKHNKVINIFGSGNIERDFIHISDVCRYLYLLAVADKCGVFNIGSGKSFKIIDIAHLMKKKFNGCELVFWKVDESPISTFSLNVEKLVSIAPFEQIDLFEWIDRYE